MSIRILFTFICIILLHDNVGISRCSAQDALSEDIPVVVEQQDTAGFLDYEEPRTMKEPDFKHLLLRIILTLCAIIVGIIGVTWLLKFILQDRTSAMQKKERYFEVVDRLYLDNKRTIYLVKIIDEILVVGGGHDSLSVLSKINDAKKVQALSSKDFLPLLHLFHKKTTQKEDTQDV